VSDTRERVISGWRLVIHRDQCIGTAACRNVVPELLDLDHQQVIDFRQDAPAVAAERLAEACQVCPVDALELFDPAGQRTAP
jgi:ferredoxin